MIVKLIEGCSVPCLCPKGVLQDTPDAGEAREERLQGSGMEPAQDRKGSLAPGIRNSLVDAAVATGTMGASRDRAAAAPACGNSQLVFGISRPVSSRRVAGSA